MTALTTPSTTWTATGLTGTLAAAASRDGMSKPQPTLQRGRGAAKAAPASEADYRAPDAAAVKAAASPAGLARWLDACLMVPAATSAADPMPSPGAQAASSPEANQPAMPGQPREQYLPFKRPVALPQLHSARAAASWIDSPDLNPQDAAW